MIIISQKIAFVAILTTADYFHTIRHHLRKFNWRTFASNSATWLIHSWYNTSWMVDIEMKKTEYAQRARDKLMVVDCDIWPTILQRKNRSKFAYLFVQLLLSLNSKVKAITCISSEVDTFKLQIAEKRRNSSSTILTNNQQPSSVPINCFSFQCISILWSSNLDVCNSSLY